MQFHVNIIDNGILISYPDENGRRREVAFTSDNKTYKEDAKALITEKKSVVADRMEQQAHNTIDNAE